MLRFLHISHLAVIDSKPLPDDPQLEAVFRIFAVRASAEVRRIRAESSVRESEEDRKSVV